MKSSSISKSVIGALLFCFGLGTGFFAQSLTDSPQRVERKRSDLAGAPGMEVIVSTAEYQPGESIDLHLHHGPEAVYVIQGATVQAPGKEPSQIPTGASLLNQRGVKHAGFAVVGETSLKLFTVHIVDKGQPLYDYGR
ncbi:MAG: cupin domain-containing protein [Burkholderiaceae bacterium]|nr:cupin domain-containing protein [Burkholderiaceae bacterium]